MVPNWLYCINKVETPYCIYVGDCDIIPQNYVTALKPLLDADPEAVMAFGYANRFEKLSGKKLYEHHYEYASLFTRPCAAERIYHFITSLSEHTLLYGLWRTQVLQECFYSQICWGPDLVTMARALEKGIFLYSPNTYISRAVIYETRREQYQRYRKSMDRSCQKITGDWLHICIKRLKELPGGQPYYKMLKSAFLVRTKRFLKNKIKGLLKKNAFLYNKAQAFYLARKKKI